MECEEPGCNDVIVSKVIARESLRTSLVQLLFVAESNPTLVSRPLLVKVVDAMTEACLEVAEAVVRMSWQHLPIQGSDTQQRPGLFMWGGKDYLLHMRTDLNFVRDSKVVCGYSH